MQHISCKHEHSTATIVTSVVPSIRGKTQHTTYDSDDANPGLPVQSRTSTACTYLNLHATCTQLVCNLASNLALKNEMVHDVIALNKRGPTSAHRPIKVECSKNRFTDTPTSSTHITTSTLQGERPTRCCPTGRQGQCRLQTTSLRMPPPPNEPGEPRGARCVDTCTEC